MLIQGTRSSPEPAKCCGCSRNNPFRDTHETSDEESTIAARPRGANAKGLSAHNARIPEFQMVFELLEWSVLLALIEVPAEVLA